MTVNSMKSVLREIVKRELRVFVAVFVAAGACNQPPPKQPRLVTTKQFVVGLSA